MRDKAHQAFRRYKGALSSMYSILLHFCNTLHLASEYAPRSLSRRESGSAFAATPSLQSRTPCKMQGGCESSSSEGKVLSQWLGFKLKPLLPAGFAVPLCCVCSPSSPRIAARLTSEYHLSLRDAAGLSSHDRSWATKDGRGRDVCCAERFAGQASHTNQRTRLDSGRYLKEHASFLR